MRVCISCLNRIDVFSQLTDFDYLTTDEFMDSIGLDSRELRTILPIMALCHGTPPAEAPFSYHCRCAFGLDSHLTAVQHGGDAFIDGFMRELKRHGARILTRTWIERLLCSATGECTTAILSSEEAVEVDEIYFTINPNDYIGLFPEESIHPRLRKRVEHLQPTCSFVTSYGIVKSQEPLPSQLTFHIDGSNLNDILLPGQRSSSTGIVISNDPMNPDPTVTAFRTMFLEDLLKEVRLDPDRSYHTQPAYLDFKAKCQRQIEEDILMAHPELKGRITMIEGGDAPFLPTVLSARRFSLWYAAAHGDRTSRRKASCRELLRTGPSYLFPRHPRFYARSIHFRQRGGVNAPVPRGSPEPPPDTSSCGGDGSLERRSLHGGLPRGAGTLPPGKMPCYVEDGFC